MQIKVFKHYCSFATHVTCSECFMFLVLLVQCLFNVLCNSFISVLLRINAPFYLSPASSYSISYIFFSKAVKMNLQFQSLVVSMSHTFLETSQNEFCAICSFKLVSKDQKLSPKPYSRVWMSICSILRVNKSLQTMSQCKRFVKISLI